MLLDLRRDRYFGLDSQQLRALSIALHANIDKQASVARIDDEDIDAFAKSLVANGLLTEDATQGKAAEKVPLEAAAEGLLSPDYAESSTISVAGIIRFLFACAYTAVQMRVTPLERVVGALRTHNSQPSQPLAAHDLARARRLTATYDRIRPFVYTQRNRCLFDSLALIRFLRCYGLTPTFVIGVQPRPFQAHSWVQTGRYVLNGSPSYAQMFVPILVA